MVDLEALEQFKQAQKKSWAHFAPLEAITTPPAARLVEFAGVRAGQRVVDVACGTGVVAITAALRGAEACGLDLTPELIARARENGAICGVDIDWREGDVERLPYADQEFDVVLSQFGHMFGPRPDVTIGEMLRVLKPGGTIAFSTWPPEMFPGLTFALTARYLPPPPAGVSPPVQWGDPTLVRERLGAAVENLRFDRDVMYFPTFSVRHQRHHQERTAGPIIKLVAELEKSDPARLEAWRAEYEALASHYFEDNRMRMSFLMSRAVKV
jgi:SAM-dependent methyltransferase